MVSLELICDSWFAVKYHQMSSHWVATEVISPQWGFFQVVTIHSFSWGYGPLNMSRNWALCKPLIHMSSVKSRCWVMNIWGYHGLSNLLGIITMYHKPLRETLYQHTGVTEGLNTAHTCLMNSLLKHLNSCSFCLNTIFFVTPLAKHQ